MPVSARATGDGGRVPASRAPALAPPPLRTPPPADTASTSSYVLPDGARLSLADEPRRAHEVLFRPSLAGLEAPGAADALALALARTDLDLRRALLSGVVLAGGATAARGFAARLLADVRASAPRDARVRVWAPADRKTLAWLGGSVLASLSTFRDMWVTRAAWEEEGPRALARFVL
jgi:actin-related protein